MKKEDMAPLAITTIGMLMKLKRICFVLTQLQSHLKCYINSHSRARVKMVSNQWNISPSIESSVMKLSMLLTWLNSIKLKASLLIEILVWATSWASWRNSMLRLVSTRLSISPLIILTQSQALKFSVSILNSSAGLKLETLVFSDLRCSALWDFQKTSVLLLGGWVLRDPLWSTMVFLISEICSGTRSLLNQQRTIRFAISTLESVHALIHPFW